MILCVLQGTRRLLNCREFCYHDAGLSTFIFRDVKSAYVSRETLLAAISLGEMQFYILKPHARARERPAKMSMLEYHIDSIAFLLAQAMSILVIYLD